MNLWSHNSDKLDDIIKETRNISGCITLKWKTNDIEYDSKKKRYLVHCVNKKIWLLECPSYWNEWLRRGIEKIGVRCHIIVTTDGIEIDIFIENGSTHNAKQANKREVSTHRFIDQYKRQKHFNIDRKKCFQCLVKIAPNYLKVPITFTRKWYWFYWFAERNETQILMFKQKPCHRTMRTHETIR